MLTYLLVEKHFISLINILSSMRLYVIIPLAVQCLEKSQFYCLCQITYFSRIPHIRPTGNYLEPVYRGPVTFIKEENGTQRGKPKLFASNGFSYVQAVWVTTYKQNKIKSIKMIKITKNYKIMTFLKSRYKNRFPNSYSR